MPETKEISDDTLIEDFLKTGNTARFEPLVRRYEKFASVYAYSLLGNEFDAQDVVADSFLKAFTKIKQYRMGTSFKNWFLKIVHNTSYDFLRKKKNQVYLDDEEVGESVKNDESLSYDNIEALNFGEMKQLLLKLSPELRSVIILRYYYDWDYQKICKFLGIPVGTLSSRLNRACKKLKFYMEEQHE
ncbi:RNA polymerase sigma factor [Eubacteriaceae bacterium ES2]|nr:RNA polymerase sigma factor [Eubacteriaceae bacterium ES2]